MKNNDFVVNDKGEEIRVGDLIQTASRYGRVIALKPKQSLKNKKVKFENPENGLLFADLKTNEEVWEFYKYCELFQREEEKYYGIYD